MPAGKAPANTFHLARDVTAPRRVLFRPGIPGYLSAHSYKERLMTTITEAFPSNFLKAQDLNDRTVKVAIDKIVFEEIGQEKNSKPILYFQGAKKGLVLNKTNALLIGAIHGEQMDEWAGKEIELFSQMVPYQGKSVPAIRVRGVGESAPAPISVTPLGAELGDDPIGI